MANLRIQTKKQKVHTPEWWTNKLDDAIRELVREKGSCEHCGSSHSGFNDAHVIGRGNKTLRWDIMNHMYLCIPCHFWWHEQPLEATKWFSEKYPERHTYLMEAKNIYRKYTEQDYINIREAIKNKDVRQLTLDILS
jgi:hypothetical protein